MQDTYIENGTPSPQEERLQTVLLSFLDAERVGQAPSRQALLAQNPDLTGELSAFLDDRDCFRKLAAAIPVVPFSRPLVVPKSIGNYEILGELGRGGMGVVYKARQAKLQRLVALKMVLDGALAGERELARFRSEAEAVARLQHPNIVQIYEVGEHEGRPFFSLEYVDGGTLAQRIGGQPQPTRQAAAIAETLARAIDYAHERGVVHRDLKPANVLLTKQGMPKITDFGLAKRLEGTDGNTRTGAIVGTPSYLAPEQALGRKDVGPAADIFALGAILHELLTGRPPFRGDTPMETILQAASCEVVPLRHHSPHIPRDLETICLKCLEKDPRKRYPSAWILANDLRRFLNGEAIEARPIGSVEAAWRWCVRRPMIAGLAAAIVLITLVGITGIFVEWRRAEAHLAYARKQRAAADSAREEAERERIEAEKARTEAERQKQQAEENFQEARTVVDDFFTRVSENLLLKAPNLEPLRAELLAAAQRYYEEFLRKHQKDPALKAALADTHFRLGTLTGISGDKARGLREVEKALAAWNELLKENPTDTRALAGAARSQLAIGRLKYDMGHNPESMRALEAGRAILEELHKRDRNDIQVRSDLIFAYNAVGVLHREARQHEQALASYEKGRRLTEEPAAFRNTSRALWFRAVFSNNIAQIHKELGRPAEARQAYESALAGAEAVLKAEPRNQRYRHSLGVMLSNAGAYAFADEWDEKVIASFQRSAEVLAVLVQESPAVTAYQFDLCATFMNCGRYWRKRKRHADALGFYAHANAILEKLSKDDPAAIPYRVRRAEVAVGRALCLFDVNRADDARKLLTDTRSELERLQRQHSDNAAVRTALADVNALLASSPAPAPQK
jgi:tetratricopeptide (TPR) repeat protein/tRNA A-37 threonylcarbamoyl transferase component Bud32